MKCFILILQFLCLYESVCDAIALNANLNLKLAIHNEMLNYLSSLIKVQTKSKNGVPSKSLIASLQNDSISSTINVDSDGFWVKFFHYDPKESFVASTHSFYFNRNYKANHELRNEPSPESLFYGTFNGTNFYIYFSSNDTGPADILPLQFIRTIPDKNVDSGGVKDKGTFKEEIPKVDNQSKIEEVWVICLKNRADKVRLGMEFIKRKLELQKEKLNQTNTKIEKEIQVQKEKPAANDKTSEFTFQVWSNCSLNCGGGDQSLIEVCDNGNKTKCIEPVANETRVCNKQACLLDLNKQSKAVLILDTDNMIPAIISIDNLILTIKSSERNEIVQEYILDDDTEIKEESSVDSSGSCFLLFHLELRGKLCGIDEKKFVEKWKNLILQVTSVKKKSFLKPPVSKKLGNHQEDMIRQSELKLRQRLINLNKLKTKRDLDTLTSATASAYQKQFLIENAFTNEVKSRSTYEETEINRRINIELEKRDLIKSEASSREKLNLDKSYNSIIQHSIKDISKSASDEIVKRREILKGKFKQLLKEKEVKKAFMLSKLNSIKSGISEIKLSESKFENDSTQCYKTEVINDSQKIQEKCTDFKSNDLISAERYEECIADKESFCLVCCEVKIGKLFYDEREGCFNKCLFDN